MNAMDPYNELAHAGHARRVAEIAQAVILVLGGLTALAALSIGLVVAIQAGKTGTDRSLIAHALIAGVLGAVIATVITGVLWSIAALLRLLAVQTEQAIDADQTRRRHAARQPPNGQQHPYGPRPPP